jgi:guanylate kinase
LKGVDVSVSGAILIVSGPSGAGKSTIIQSAKPYIGDFYFSISTTTREPRDGEIDGVDYHFVDRESFKRGIERGEFLEYAEVHGNYYGTSLEPVKKALLNNKLVIFDIDVQGHRLARERLNSLITSIFITPTSLYELEKRLHLRGVDSREVIDRRLKNAKEEMKYIGEYDYLILNENIESAIERFVAVAKASRIKSSLLNLENFLLHWLKDDD